MFKTNAAGSSYSTKVGKRTDPVKTGCFVIEHEPTGRFIAGTSRNVSADVEVHLQHLYLERHKNRIMNECCRRELQIRVHEFPTKTVADAREVLKEIKDSATPGYLYLGE